MGLKDFLTSDDRKGGLLARLFRLNTVWGDEPGEEYRTPYMTTLRIAPRRFIHIFWRMDFDNAYHDHMWDFWTFPIYPRKGYVEEYLATVPEGSTRYYALVRYEAGEQYPHTQIVQGWRWHFRKAEHAHKVLFPNALQYVNWGPLQMNDGWQKAGGKSAQWPIVTYVVKSKKRREWGFYVPKLERGRWCWKPWRSYIDGDRSC